MSGINLDIKDMRFQFNFGTPTPWHLRETKKVSTNVKQEGFWLSSIFSACFPISISFMKFQTSTWQYWVSFEISNFKIFNSKYRLSNIAISTINFKETKLLGCCSTEAATPTPFAGGKVATILKIGQICPFDDVAGVLVEGLLLPWIPRLQGF